MKISLENNIYEVTFDYAPYHHILIEPGAKPYSWVFTQQLKSWLSTNMIKVFTDFNCGDFGESSPITTLRFLKQQDAQEFYDTWNRE